jgi:hypothetical protein
MVEVGRLWMASILAVPAIVGSGQTDGVENSLPMDLSLEQSAHLRALSAIILRC